jgi:cobalt-zinc-cadmium efflux system protein
MRGSVAVIVGAIVTHFTGRTIVDPVLAVLIGLEKVRTALTQDVGVTEIHDLHVWSLGSRRLSLTAHVVAAEGVEADALRRRMNEVLHAEFDVEHSTLQVETTACSTTTCDPHDHEHAHPGSIT